MEDTVWTRLEDVSRALARFGRIHDLGEVRHGKLAYPLRSISLGSRDPKAPAFGLVGGVHGLEIVGTEVVLAFLEGLVDRLKWDRLLAQQLEQSRWSFLPLVNPIGMALGRRSNGNGVDLMRNAPVEAEEKPLAWIGGHRVGPWLPWYRGPMGAPMERENQLLVHWVEQEFFDSAFTVVIDVHSGFGFRDRLWYPYAKSRRAFPYLNETKELLGRLHASLPHHVYLVENQSATYTTHGDVWDFLVDRVRKPNVFVPLTLELGSWLWVRKNPLQMRSIRGLYNPIKTHRRRRTFRRHLPLFEFLSRYVGSWGRGPNMP